MLDEDDNVCTPDHIGHFRLSIDNDLRRVGFHRTRTSV
jgi:hypothetical protein